MSELSLIELYERAVRHDGLQDDASQRLAIKHLQSTYDHSFNTGLLQRHRWLRRILRVDNERKQGLYIWGGVGRGKTLLMDLFFNHVPVSSKKRTHFHRFMQSVHQQMKMLQDTSDPLSKIGRKIAKECRLLCLDEFFVLDIGDAVILSGLLHSLLANGVVMVITSNTKPEDLYLGGIQRDRFMAAIRLIKTRMEVIRIDDGQDHRLQSLTGQKLYYDHLSAATDAALHQLFERWRANTPRHTGALTILNRSIQTVAYTESLVWFEFIHICDGPRSKADYIEIANLYRTVIISNIPYLTWEYENQTRRLIELVDELYDRGVHLVISARSAIGSLYTGKRLIKEFERTISRVHEMQTDRYLSRMHCG